jgi:7-cyano-7-deazaguanine synthase in queuosine biosynthesis
MSVQNSPGLRPSRQDHRKQLMLRIAGLIDEARRHSRVLSADAETDRLTDEYPNCPMSKTELRATIVRLAAEAQVNSNGTPQKTAKRK